MATTAQVNLNLNLQNAEESIGKLNKETKTTLNTLTGLREESERLSKELENIEIGTEAYSNLSKELIKVNVQLKNQELALEALDNEQLAGELKSVAGGLSDMAGGLALIGVSSSGVEQIAQTFAKVEGITKAVTGGIEAYSSGVKVLNALSAKGATLQSVLAAITGTQAAASTAASTALVGQTAATEGATVASNALNISLLANPILLIVAGITAAVAALAFFSEETETAEQANEKLNASIERQNAILERKNDRLIRNAQNAVALAEAEGRTEEEVLQLKLDLLRKEEDARLRTVQQLEFNLQDKTNLYKRALREEDEELARKIKDEITAEKEKLYNLRNLQGQYQADRRVLLAQAATKEREEEEKREKEAEEKRRQRAEQALRERINNSKKLAEELRKLEQDEELRNADTEQQRLEILANRQIKELELIYSKSRKTKQDSENLAEAIKDVNEKLQFDIQNIEKKASIEREKIEKDRIDNIKKQEQEFQNTIDDIQEQNYQSTLTEQQRELRLINDKYFALEEAAKDNAEQLKIIEEAKNREIAEANKKADDAELARQKEKLDKIQQLYGVFASTVTQTLDIISQVQAENNARESAESELRLQNQTEFLNQQLVDRQISQEEYNTKIKILEQQRASEELELKRKAFKQQKALQIANATIQGAQAVLAAFSSGVATPLIGPATGAIYAGLAGAFAAAQIGVIASQQFRAAKGGLVPRNGRSQNEDSVNALLAPGEAVINSSSTQAFLPLLSAINQAGGGTPLMKDIQGISSSNVIKVYQDQPVVQAYITEQQVTQTQKRVNGIKNRSKLF